MSEYYQGRTLPTALREAIAHIEQGAYHEDCRVFIAQMRAAADVIEQLERRAANAEDTVQGQFHEIERLRGELDRIATAYDEADKKAAAEDAELRVQIYNALRERDEARAGLATPDVAVTEDGKRVPVLILHHEEEDARDAALEEAARTAERFYAAEEYEHIPDAIRALKGGQDGEGS